MKKFQITEHTVNSYLSNKQARKLFFWFGSLPSTNRSFCINSTKLSFVWCLIYKWLMTDDYYEKKSCQDNLFLLTFTCCCCWNSFPVCFQSCNGTGYLKTTDRNRWWQWWWWTSFGFVDVQMGKLFFFPNNIWVKQPTIVHMFGIGQERRKKHWSKQHK